MSKRELVVATAPPGVPPGEWQRMVLQKQQNNQQSTEAKLDALGGVVERYKTQQRAQQRAVANTITYAVTQAVEQQVAPVVRQVAELQRKQAMRERDQAGLTVHSQQPPTDADDDYTLPEELCE